MTPDKISKKTINKKRFLVTGGAGFIGSALVRGLLKEFPKCSIIVIDNLSTGNKKNLTEVLSKIKFYNKDLRNYKSIAPLFKNVDIVFHEAAIPSVPRSIHLPMPSHDSNVNGTFNALLASKEAGVKKFIFASSSSAYGDNSVLPKHELLANNPKSPYAVQKIIGEYYCKVFKKVYGMETVALRYFNVFGPRQNPSSPYSGITSLFMKSAIQKQAPTLFGDGEQTRDFTFVENIVDLNIRAAKSKNFNQPIYNGAAGQRTSLNKILQTVQEISNIKLPPKYGPERIGDVKHSHADIQLARKDFGYKPKYNLKTGLQITYNWYKDNIE